MPPSDHPFFSVLITAYNRAGLIARCVDSCARQTFDDLEIVVVDDASVDGTVDVLAALAEPRLRVVRHQRNQGYMAARATAVDHARGEWIVMVDSDDELVPGALARLKELIDGLPAEVRIIRSRQRLDDGSVTPGVLPPGLTDYHGRLSWLEAVAGGGVATDAGHCMHRSIFERANYFRDRRGVMEPLWELDLARSEQSLWVPDILGLVHDDAPDRHSRDRNPRRLVPRVLAEAPDQLWMTETMFDRHGSALARFAPRYRRQLLESAAQQSFLVGDRLRGIRHARAASVAGANRRQILSTVVLGSLGPRTLAYAKVGIRQWRARRIATP